MKRVLTAVSLIFCLVAAGCSTPKTITVTQVKTTTPVKATAKPVIYELKMYGIDKETNGIVIPVSIGDRIEIGVSRKQESYNVMYSIFCFMQDNNGNTVVESARKTVTYLEPAQYYVPGGQLQSPAKVVTTVRDTQKYPWHYSCYSAIDGVYVFGVAGNPAYSADEPDVSVRITVYPAN
jgi:hypothetical protein